MAKTSESDDTFKFLSMTCVGDAEGNYVYSSIAMSSASEVAEGLRKFEVLVPDCASLQELSPQRGDGLDKWDYVLVKCTDGLLVLRVLSIGAIGESVTVQRTKDFPIVTEIDDLDEFREVYELMHRNR